MKCPICEVELNMSERQGIEIDYCPKCRGVWLDRGELDKIIEKSNTESQVTPTPNSASESIFSKFNEHSDHQDGHHNDKHKKRSPWGELFDF
ncbi:MAG: zf-TFIIB domain-containing protein [Candidatus Falkowbacteria bacterium]